MPRRHRAPPDRVLALGPDHQITPTSQDWLNLLNLQESGGLEVIDAAGSHPTTGQRVDQTYAIVQPRSFYVTAKLGF